MPRSRGANKRGLDSLVARTAGDKPWLRRGTEPGDLPAQPRNECEIILTLNKGTRDRLVAVRCYCMNGYRYSRRYYGYDLLGVVGTLHEALRLWNEHVAERRKR